MTKRKVFSIIVICLAALMIGNMFFPLYTLEGTSATTWGTLNIGGKTIFITLACFIIIFTSLDLADLYSRVDVAFIGAGYYFFSFLGTFLGAIENGLLKNYGAGLWVGLLASLTLVILIFLASISEIKGGNLDKPEKERKEKEPKENKDKKNNNNNNNNNNKNMPNNNMNNPNGFNGYNNPNGFGPYNNYPNGGMYQNPNQFRR